MGVTVGWDVWAPVLRGEASQGPSVPIQSRGRDSYGPCLPCSRHLVFTRGGLWALRRGGQRARSHTPMWDSHQALPALLSGVRNWNKLTAPKQADGDAGSGCPPAKRDRLIDHVTAQEDTPKLCARDKKPLSCSRFLSGVMISQFVSASAGVGDCLVCVS